MSLSDRPTDRVESRHPEPEAGSGISHNNAPDFHAPPSASRVGAARLREIAEQLSPRDLRILSDLSRLRVLSGRQLERLHFQGGETSARGRARRRVLRRLVSLSLVTTLDRRIGGVRAGSAGLIYALTAAGQRLLDDGPSTIRRRNPREPGTLFHDHALAISQLIVELHEQTEARSASLVGYSAEHDATWLAPDRHGQLKPLRPDLHLLLATETVEDAWWIEVDRATESLPRLHAKLESYLRLARSGRDVPGGLMPRVLVTVPHESRLAAAQKTIRAVRAPEGLFQAVLHEQAAGFLVDELVGEIDKPP